MPFLEGFFTGVATIIFLGPVFFTLLQITLHHGKKAGLSVALGIIVSDIVIITLFYVGAVDFFQEAQTQYWLAVIGSILLFGLGIKFIFKPHVLQATKPDFSLANISSSFAKGFLVNFVNPFVFVVWISILTYAEGTFKNSTDVQVYLLAVLSGIFFTDALKVLLANKLQPLLKPLFLKRLFALIGIILIGFGLRLIYFIATNP